MKCAHAWKNISVVFDANTGLVSYEYQCQKCQTVKFVNKKKK